MSASSAGGPQTGFTAELADQDDPQIGRERIVVRHSDGRVEEVALHEYGRVYSLPGVYEQIVTDRLGCRSPWEIAGMLAAAVDRVGWERERVRVIDLAAGNGVSGEALAAEGLIPVLGSDIVPEARAAALRDRPGLYDEYLTLDLLTLTAAQERAIAGLRPNAICCVAPVGDHGGQLPAPALAAAARLLAPEALVAYMHDPMCGEADPVTEAFWAAEAGARGQELERRRYLHRRTVNGRAYEMVGVVWRLSAEAGADGRQAQ